MTTSQSVIPLDIGHPATPDAPARFVWRNQYDTARDAIERKLAETQPEGETLTVQHMKDETDINVVMERFGITDGSRLPTMDFSKVDPSYYGDFSDATDLRTALARFDEAAQRFMLLPAKLRARFNNNWHELHDWVSNPANLDEAIGLGMLTAPEGWLAPDARQAAVPPTTTPPQAAPTP